MYVCLLEFEELSTTKREILFSCFGDEIQADVCFVGGTDTCV